MPTKTSPLRIYTSRFGEVAVPPEQLIRFPRGLYGFEAVRRFFLLPHDDDGLFFWLQAAEESDLAMLVTNPLMFFPEYELEVSDADADLLEANSPADLSVFAILTVHRAARQVTANLLGPVLINAAARFGLQIELDPDRYTTRRPLPSREAA